MLRTCLEIETLFNNLNRENLFESFQSFRSLKFSSMNTELLDKIIDIIWKKACEKPEIVALFGFYYIYLTDSGGGSMENRQFIISSVRFRFNGWITMTNELQENIDSIFEFITHLYSKNRYFGGSVVTQTVSLPTSTRKPTHVGKPKKRAQTETSPPVDFRKPDSNSNPSNQVRVPLEVLRNNSKIENLRKTIEILAVENVKKLKIIKKLRKVIAEQNAEIQELKKEKMCEEVERIHRKYQKILRIEDFDGFIEKINEYLSVSTSSEFQRNSENEAGSSGIQGNSK
ncbi:unnamed protein product [Caenorhabditis angaria]|uniref:Uncharacterized protein n=1 Tax=Caenorhabditis angaria TaxID=860376 RepID=A0A9P1IN64_9PELO|nr:unnamed protein product [Caenorhabditis angaria]